MRAGTKLGAYEVVEPLGAGGMGEVYRARDAELGRDVALKLLPDDLADDPERLGRLKREARSLAALNHPNVATIHGFEQHEGRSFIVMELVEGDTLARRLVSGHLSVKSSLELGIQIAEALGAAHEQGIVHRDLKPDNIALLPDGRVKVLDFGLAKQTRNHAPAAPDTQFGTVTVEPTRAGAVMGTPPYMSPEQIRGEGVDARSDIWAFGCVLYEMLTGRRAFEAETPSDTLADILRSEPDWDALPPDLADPIDRVLRRCLAKPLDQRLGHLADVRIELQDAMAELGPTATRPTPRPAASAGSRRMMQVAVGLSVVAIMAVAAAWYASSGRGGSSPELSIAVLPFETLGGEDATGFTDGIHGDMLTRLSGISELKVTSRTSVMRFRDSDRPLPDVARELGVRWVLQGEVQEAGDEVQVNARLIDAQQDRQVWADSYRRRLTAGNLFDIQGELTRAIVYRLEGHLTGEEEGAVDWSPTENLTAYRSYARGRSLLDQRTPVAMRSASAHFRDAVEEDPDYALAWVGLADSLGIQASYGYAPADEMRPQAAAALERALEIDPELAQAHASLGMMLTDRGDGEAAIRSLHRAIELRPGYAEAYNWLSWLYSLAGRPDAAREAAERSVELDPLSPEAVSNLSLALLLSGRYEEALAEARHTLELQPAFATGGFYEALALHHLGRSAEAASVLDGLPVPWTRYGALSTRAIALAASGDEAASAEILEELERLEDWFDVGLVRAALDDQEGALDAFSRTSSWDYWTSLASRTLFPDILGPLRDAPRYRAMLSELDRSMGIR